MRITVLKLKTGVSFVQFGRTFGGNLRFTSDPTPGAPGSIVRNVIATARPDVAGVILETTIINHHTGKIYNPYVVPFESIDGFEVDRNTIPAPAAVVADGLAPEKAEELVPQRKKPGPKPRIAVLAVLLALFAQPSFASDAASDLPHPLKNIVCFNAPAPGCLTCVHMVSQDFEVVCGLPEKKAEKKAKKKKKSK